LDTGRVAEYNLLGGYTGSLALATGQGMRQTFLDPHLPVSFRRIFC
jgi:hypothetical protein